MAHISQQQSLENFLSSFFEENIFDRQIPHFPLNRKKKLVGKKFRNRFLFIDIQKIPLKLVITVLKIVHLMNVKKG
jgi:hypothetical protein